MAQAVPSGRPGVERFSGYRGLCATNGVGLPAGALPSAERLRTFADPSRTLRRYVPVGGVLAPLGAPPAGRRTALGVISPIAGSSQAPGRYMPRPRPASLS